MGSVGANKGNNAVKAMTEQEYLDSKGVGDVASGIGIDRYAGANRTRLSQKARQREMEKLNKENEEYYRRRAEARKEYRENVQRGEIRDKTNIEKMIERANGNPELSATQAARRMAEKRGIDWRTGKKLKR